MLEAAALKKTENVGYKGVSNHEQADEHLE